MDHFAGERFAGPGRNPVGKGSEFIEPGPDFFPCAHPGQRWFLFALQAFGQRGFKNLSL